MPTSRALGGGDGMSSRDPYAVDANIEDVGVDATAEGVTLSGSASTFAREAKLTNDEPWDATEDSSESTPALTSRGDANAGYSGML